MRIIEFLGMVLQQRKAENREETCGNMESYFTIDKEDIQNYLSIDIKGYDSLTMVVSDTGLTFLTEDGSYYGKIERKIDEYLLAENLYHVYVLLCNVINHR